MKLQSYICICASLICVAAGGTQVFAESGSPNASRSPKPALEKFPEKETRLEKLANTDTKIASKNAELQKRVEEQKNKIASKEAELKERMEEKREKIASNAAQRFEDRCKILNERTKLTLTRYENNKSKHLEDYQNVKKRVEEVIKRVKTAGGDTTKLEADLVQLNSLITKASSDYAAFIDALKATNNYACGKSEGAYATALKSAQEKLMVARQSMLSIRNYYQATIRPDIEAVKKSLPSKSPKASPLVSTSPSATTTASPAATQ